MKYLSQFVIIIGVTVAAELIKFLLPLPVPASIYGLVLLAAALLTGRPTLSKSRYMSFWRKKLRQLT